MKENPPRGGVFQCAETKAEQDTLLDPQVDAPTRGRRGVGRCCADVAALQRAAKLHEYVHRAGVPDRRRASGEIAFDQFLKLGNVHCPDKVYQSGRSLARQEAGSGSARDRVTHGSGSTALADP